MEIPSADMADPPEGEVCRVCRLEAEPDNPLYHPCKCSGSIRWVHSDCLIQWLGHSGKKACELCGYPFTFKKFYPPDMPTSLPAFKLVQQALLSYFSYLLLFLRAIIVASAWLAFLPLMAILLWRNLLSAGGQAAFWLAGKDPRMWDVNGTLVEGWDKLGKNVVMAGREGGVNGTVLTSLNGTAEVMNGTINLVNQTTAPVNGSQIVKGSLYDLIRTHGLKKVVIAVGAGIYKQITRTDVPEIIFKGQIITISMIIIFLSIFLLREWIFQVGPEPIEPVVQEDAIILPPPKPEDFKPEMAVKWRKARKVEKKEGQVFVGDGVAGIVGGPLHYGLEKAEAELQDKQEELQEAQQRLEQMRRQLRGLQGRPVPAIAQQGLGGGQLGIQLGGPFELPIERPDRPANMDGFIPPAQPEDQLRSTLEPEAGSSIPAGPSRLATALPEDDGDDAWEDMNAAEERFVNDRALETGGFLNEVAERQRTRDARHRYFKQQAYNSNGLAAPPGENAEAGPSSRLDTPSEVPVQRRSPRLNRAVDVSDQGEGPAALMGGDGPKSMAGFVGGAQMAAGFDNIRDQFRQIEEMQREQVGTDHDQVRALEQARAFDQVRERFRQIEEEQTIAEQIMNHRDDPIIPDMNDDAEEVIEGPEPGDDDDFDDIPPGEDGGIIMEGDVDGILEAIGMQGPPVALIQNVLLILVVLASALCVLVGLPYIIGKTHLLSDVSILFTLIKFPIRLIRLITDPIIDVVVDMVKIVILKPLGFKIRTAPDVVGLVDSPEAVAGHATKAFHLRLLGPIASVFGDANTSEVTLPKAWMFPFSHTEDGFAKLGSATVWLWKVGRRWINGVGASHTTTAKAAAVSLGYVDLLICAAAVVGYGEQIGGEVGKTVADTIAAHSDVLKLGFFMAIELAFFPLGMGYCLDFFTLPLFPEGTLASRMDAHAKYKLVGMFSHWLLGTHFMFAFAKFLSVCRSLCRRGAMYIIRDPSDPSFSPVKDILGKKSISQLAKLCISAAMYLSVLGGPLGGVLWLVRRQPLLPSLLPLRWTFQSPISQIPADLLMLLFVIPHHLGKVRLDQHFREYCRFLWAKLAKGFRLSSYMRGTRYIEQETPGRVEETLLRMHFSLKSRWSKSLGREPPKWTTYEGTTMRVPYVDQVVLIRPRRAVFIPVDEQGMPKSDEDKITALKQDRAAVKAHRNPAQDYCMVYLPPFYRERFWAFGCLLWTTVAFSLVMAACLPLAVGRAVLSKVSSEDLHDGYSFLTGGYVLYILLVVGWYAGKRTRSIIHRVATTPRYRDPWSPWRGLFKFSSAFMYVARRAYVIFTVLFCMPVGVGMLLELYVLQPIKYGASDMTPVIYPFEAWSYGAVLVSLIYMSRRMRIAFLHAIHRHEVPGGFFRLALRPRNVNRQLLLPVAARILLASAIPACAGLLITKVLRLEERGSALCFRFAYPVTATFFSMYALRRTISSLFKMWSQALLEKEYLVEKRVMNMEDVKSSSVVSVGVGGAAAAAGTAGANVPIGADAGAAVDIAAARNVIQDSDEDDVGIDLFG